MWLSWTRLLEMLWWGGSSRGAVFKVIQLKLDVNQKENNMSILDNVYNYYEKLVLEEIAEQTKGSHCDQDFITDAVCVALNNLPSRYFRHGVDMAFYLPTDDFLTMKQEVAEAVKGALSHVGKNERGSIEFTG